MLGDVSGASVLGGQEDLLFSFELCLATALQPAWVHTLSSIRCCLAIFFWIMPGHHYCSIEVKREFSENLLFSFELCFVERLCKLYSSSCRLYLLFSFELCPPRQRPQYQAMLSFCLAIFFWIMPSQRWASESSRQRCATCYFLLNYARNPNHTSSSWVSYSKPCYFLLNYATNWVGDIWWGLSVQNLLFSFELCPG